MRSPSRSASSSRSDIAGFITGLRFYKGALNTGTHFGNLWNSTGASLASATFTNETASGWQTVSFASPVAIAANTTYVASYHTDTGFYSADIGYFASTGFANSPLRALGSGVDGPNGVYGYGPTAFPANSGNGNNYWVDVVFAVDVTPDTTPPTVTITEPTDGASLVGVTSITALASDDVGVTSVQFQVDGVDLGAPVKVPPYTVNWDTATVPNGPYQLTAIAADAANNSTTSPVVNVTVNNPLDTTPPTVAGVTPADGTVDVAVDTLVTATFDEPMDPATVNGTTVELRDSGNNLIAATVSYDVPSRTATLTAASPLANSSVFTPLVKGGVVEPTVKDVAGNALAADFVWRFTTEAAPGENCPCSIWDESVVPAVEEQSDPNAIEIGVKFQSDIAGFITGLRFYKGALNTVTHIGNLWTSDGTLLAQATFTNESPSGWQTVSFASPVLIAANTTYVASYHTTVGFYSADVGYFGTGLSNPPLRALGNGEDGPNGVYAYGPTGFPSNSGQRRQLLGRRRLCRRCDA